MLCFLHMHECVYVCGWRALLLEGSASWRCGWLWRCGRSNICRKYFFLVFFVVIVLKNCIYITWVGIRYYTIAFYALIICHTAFSGVFRLSCWRFDVVSCWKVFDVMSRFWGFKLIMLALLVLFVFFFCEMLQMKRKVLNVDKNNFMIIFLVCYGCNPAVLTFPAKQLTQIAFCSFGFFGFFN